MYSWYPGTAKGLILKSRVVDPNPNVLVGFVFGKRSNLESVEVGGKVPFHPYIIIPGIQGQLKAWY